MTVHPACRDALRAEIRAEAARYQTQADTFYRQPLVANVRGYARRSRLRATALGWAEAAIRRATAQDDDGQGGDAP